MKTKTFLEKVGAGLSLAILIVAVSACAHHKVTEGQDYGQVRTEASANQPTSNDQVVGSAPAPANAQNVQGATTPAIISGPAKIDNSGRAYTSSSVGSTGNATGTGLNTNVNIIPEKSTSNVTVTQSPAVTTETQTTVAETTPAPVMTETPAPAPTVTETQTTTTTESVPMTSSTTQESTTTTTTHRRMRKD